MDKALSEQDYGTFRRYLEGQCGIVLGDNKQYLVKSRLTPLLGRYKQESLGQLIQMVINGRDRELQTAVIDAMTTNETLWFRDSYPFELLTEKLFPELGKGGKTVRIWSAACSSGQEPYSIAIKALEHQVKKPGTLPGGVQILATDISQGMLSQCQVGEYDSLALGRGMSDERRRLYFDETPDGTWKVKGNVKRLVTFRHFNLLSSYALLGKFDLVFCRNVLIYFSQENKLKILEGIARTLNPGGYLFLGASESMPTAATQFEMVRCNPGILYRRKENI
ncbi:protein-glutamate O-methyltransferase CheR [Gallaecimonas kandeliae]|uniref:CheR family methyltransferase n=1 Tax=Gallaecimonas kandeliae TaxID=3029055 RepID=UPI0026492873|nr:protein-glutamate O-methyltransferase CheR [Gallaecimonas kandeliae]WKE66706.1 protein-glutamate O-methyltransferase CheR [Gallaecimonas kandeliae]